MEETTKREFRWFWAWNDEKEEIWLGEMAQQGWHLTKPGAFGFYTFARGEPKNVVYQLDYKAMGKDLDDYLQLFVDAGWEHVGTMGGWQYFRKETVEGESPEIYTDAASKIQKYQRVLLFLIILLPIYTNMSIHTARSPYAFMKALGLFFTFFILLYAYAMFRLIARIQKLKKQI